MVTSTANSRTSAGGRTPVTGHENLRPRFARLMFSRTSSTSELTERAARDVGKDVDRAVGAGANVIVYYADEAGSRVAHYFKRVS